MAYDEKEVGAGKVVNVYNTGDDDAPLKFKAGQTDITDDMKSQMTGGLAQLDPATHKIKTEQLPSYVDDVVEGYYNPGGDYPAGAFYYDADMTAKISPEKDKIYVDVSTELGKSYRWSGSKYIAIAAITTEYPDVLIRVLPFGDDPLTPAAKLNYFAALRCPGVDTGYGLVGLNALAAYLFANTGSNQNVSVGILDQSDGMGIFRAVTDVWMLDGGGKYAFALSDGSYFTIDRGNMIEIEGEYYYAWDFVPASAPVESDFIANVTGDSTALSPELSSDKTAAEIIAAMNAGRNVRIRVNGADSIITTIDSQYNIVGFMHCEFGDFEIRFHGMQINSSGVYIVRVWSINDHS